MVHNRKIRLPRIGRDPTGKSIETKTCRYQLCWLRSSRRYEARQLAENVLDLGRILH